MGKKKMKAKLAQEKHIADELFLQVGILANQLQRVDQILTEAELYGPTIEAWAMQVRDLLSSLVKERGLVSGSIAQAFTVQRVPPHTAPSNEAPDTGEYAFLTDADLVAPRFGDGRNGDFIR